MVCEPATWRHLALTAYSVKLNNRYVAFGIVSCSLHISLYMTIAVLSQIRYFTAAVADLCEFAKENEKLLTENMFGRVQNLCSDMWPSAHTFGTGSATQANTLANSDASASNTKQLQLNRIKAYIGSMNIMSTENGSPLHHAGRPLHSVRGAGTQSKTVAYRQKVDRRTKPLFTSTKLVERIFLRSLERLSGKTRRYRGCHFIKIQTTYNIIREGLNGHVTR
jgi:hypothetical protein